MCTRHRLLCLPTQPSQPADSAFRQNCTLALPRLQVFSMVNAGAYTQSTNNKGSTVIYGP